MTTGSERSWSIDGEKCSYSQSRTTNKTLLSWFSRFTLLKKNHIKMAVSLWVDLWVRITRFLYALWTFHFHPLHTYICSLWSRESHHSGLSASSLWTRWAGATVLTGGSLSETPGTNQHWKSWNWWVLVVTLLLLRLQLVCAVLLNISY